MIRQLRSFQPRMGKEQQAVAWAREVAAYVEQMGPYRNVKTYTEMFGHQGRIFWIGEYDTLADLEQHTMAYTTDERWLELLTRGSEVCADGTLRDLLLTEV